MIDNHVIEEARHYFTILHKRRVLVGTCLGVALLTAFLYNHTTRPVYEAHGRMLIEYQPPNIVPNQQIVARPEGGAVYFQTQNELLRGRELAERLVERMGLHKNAEFAAGPWMSPWERLRARIFGGKQQASAEMALSPAVTALRSRLRLEPISGTQLVTLRFQAYDPKLAMDVVNTLAALYIEQSLDNRFRITTEATGWLAERVKDQQRKAEEASRALQAFCEREGMSFAGRQELQDQKMTALNAAALAAQTERITKENLASQLRALSPAERMNFPLIRGNTVVQTLRAEIAKLQEEERQMADRLGDRHPDLVDVRARIARTQEKLATEVREIAGMVESDYATAQKQEQHLRANAAAANREALTLSQKTIEYDALKRSVEIHQQLLKDLLGRSKETDLESELKATSLRLVERAELPQAPILPQRLRNYQIALLLGLALGVALSVLLERLDNTIKTPEDVRTQLNVPFLGMVPELLEHANPTADGAPVILKNPQSSPAEAYRVLRTNLAFCAAERSGRAYVVSSANPSEGKTTSVANLAIALAQSGARVLAIDADLRRPTLHQHFSVAKTPGLTDVIVSNCGLNEAVQGTSVRGLYLLPCGYVPPNPTDLLGSESMKDLVCELRQRYDWVLIDAPPILAMADAPLLCPLVEGLVLVVWAEKSGRPAIQRAIDSIGAVGGKLAGVVLNRVDLQRNSYYYSQHYGEYYRSYYLAQNETVRRPAKVVGKVGRS